MTTDEPYAGAVDLTHQKLERDRSAFRSPGRPKLRLRFPDEAPLTLEPTDAQLARASADLPAGGQLISDYPSGTGHDHYAQLWHHREGFYQFEIRAGSAHHHFQSLSTSVTAVQTAWLDWAHGGTGWCDMLPWTNYPAGTNLFAARPYDLTVFVVGPSTSVLWDRATWLGAVPVLEPLIRSTRGAIGVTSMQENLDAPDRAHRFVPFGRMGWTAQSHRKWTHDGQQNWSFLDTRIYSPGRLVCHRQGLPPDVFVQIHHSRPYTESASTLPVWYWLLLATAADQPHPALPGVIDHFAQTFRPTLMARAHRPWALALSENSHAQALGDTVQVLAPWSEMPNHAGPDMLARSTFGTDHSASDRGWSTIEPAKHP